jgi:hypothetical protein
MTTRGDLRELPIIPTGHRVPTTGQLTAGRSSLGVTAVTTRRRRPNPIWAGPRSPVQAPIDAAHRARCGDRGRAAPDMGKRRGCRKRPAGAAQLSADPTPPGRPWCCGPNAAHRIFDPVFDPVADGAAACRGDAAVPVDVRAVRQLCDKLSTVGASKSGVSEVRPADSPMCRTSAYDLP